MKRAFSLAFAALLLSSGLAEAGTFAVSFDAGLRAMSNSPETEKAIFGEKRGTGAGLGVSYDRNSRWRFAVDFRRVSREGQRAFAIDRNSEAFQLGHPLKFNLTEGVASASFLIGQIGPISPYLTLGVGRASWKEESNIAGLIEKSDGSATLFEARLGIERQQGPIRLGIEGGLTMIPNSVGVGGISKVYEETDIGGLFVVMKIGFAKR